MPVGTALEGGPSRRVFSAGIRNSDRAVGALLSGELARRHGIRRLKDAAADGPFFRALLRGSAGQSLGAFLAPGVEITVEGDANDYAGKGLCGGRLIIRPADPDAPSGWSPVRPSPATWLCTEPPAEKPTSGAARANASRCVHAAHMGHRES